MGYEAELSQHYKVIHNRLFPPKPKTLKPPELKPPVVVPIKAPERDPQVRVFEKCEISEAAPVMPARPHVSELLEWVCTVERIDPQDLRSPKLRKRRLSHARFIVCHLARKYAFCSFPEIGREIGGIDHSSVIYAVNRVARLRATSPIWNEYIKVYEKVLERNFGDCVEKPRLCPSCPFKV